MKSRFAKRLFAATMAGCMTIALGACTQAPVTSQKPAGGSQADDKQPAFAGVFSDDDVQPVEPNTVKNADGSITYTLRTKRYSHWKFKEDGTMDQVSDTKINAEDKWYGFDKEFSSKDTAFIVMDPWIDWADDFVNDYFGEITQKTTLPLMQAAAESGHTVIILTNDPAKVTYNTKIDPGLQALVDAGKAELLYHTDYTVDTFLQLLESKGIKKLMYTGYASNMCVLFRELGIARMALTGKVETYFIPECSGALEHADTWDTQEIHNATTLVISQTQALLVDFDDIMKAIKQ